VRHHIEGDISRDCAGLEDEEGKDGMVRKNRELRQDVHGEQRALGYSDDLKDGEEFQRRGEKFQRYGDGGLINLLCSLRPHDRNVLPQCAQWETDSGHREALLALGGRGVTSKLGGSVIIL
jgi:hypothetical protein